MTCEYLIDLENADNYRKFMRTALKYADGIGVSYTSDLSAFKESRWWELLGGSVTGHEYDEQGTLMLRLKVDHATCDWLKSKKSIFDFWETEDDQMLWDLCLYKDGRVIFSSITHER